MFFISITLFINIFAYALFLLPIIPQANQLYRDGLIVKSSGFHYAMVFAHGYWNGEAHYTYLNDDRYLPDSQNIPTLELINKLKAEGYNHIWPCQYETGDSDFIDGRVRWDSLKSVSRKKSPGPSFPVWAGWFWRL